MIDLLSVSLTVNVVFVLFAAWYNFTLRQQRQALKSYYKSLVDHTKPQNDPTANTPPPAGQGAAQQGMYL